VDRVTFCVTTFERPGLAQRCTNSIRERYPDAPVLVADNSETAGRVDGADVFPLPFDCGISACRNALLDLAETPLVMFCDDDFVLTDESDVDALIPVGGVDLVAGMVLRPGETEAHYEGRLIIEDRVLRYVEGPHRDGWFDIVFNWFVADTDAVRQVRWDPLLKLAEHTDFFLRARGVLKVGYNPDVSVSHRAVSPGGYREWRSRGWDYARKMFEKHGIDYAVGFDGKRWPPCDQ
jgi:glycosyltransferase involved in cell wall biosynthesis